MRKILVTFLTSLITRKQKEVDFLKEIQISNITLNGQEYCGTLDFSIRDLRISTKELRIEIYRNWILKIAS